MKKLLLKHLTVKGFVKGADLTNCENLEKNLDEAKSKQKLVKQEVAEAKRKLNIALEASLAKLDDEKKNLKNIKNKDNGEALFTTMFSPEQIKTKYDETITDLELRKNEIKMKIEDYKSDGSEKWDSFKQKLNHDLDELGKALRGFTMHAQ